MSIKNKNVVSIHYTLTDNDGKVLDSSEGKEPLSYLHGTGGIIPGLEKELAGKAAGDKLKVTVKPEEGYGILNPELVQVLPKSAFAGIDDLQVGMQLQGEDDQGRSMIIIVKEVKENEVVIDGNHPLAGQTLNFDVSIEEVREASKEELEHGHVH